MNIQKESTEEQRSSPPCSADPFPKWQWMMKYCLERKWHPSDFWDLAEKAWYEKIGPK